ncbi:MAG: hypothetical protein RLZZ53_3443 [Acidobacteriota bacterium]|jgi:hypothetical protein
MTDTARRILMAILMLGVAGISVELWLLDHVEDAYQLIPMGLNAAAILVAALVTVRPSMATLRLFQAVMLLMLVSGAVGVWLHYQVNTEFQLEMDPQLSGLALFRKSIVAKAPPALAPGAMVQLGLIGLAYTFRHPASARRG